MKYTKEKSKEFESYLKEKGYFKYVQNYKNEDYLYWKSFDKRDYSVGFAFYDFSKYPQFKEKYPISISLEFMLGVNADIDRLEISISDDRISVEEFEKFCSKFYDFYKLGILK
jgi:hypothetical protein